MKQRIGVPAVFAAPVYQKQCWIQQPGLDWPASPADVQSIEERHSSNGPGISKFSK